VTVRYGVLLRRLLLYLKPHRLTLAAGVLCALVVAAAGGLIAWLVKPVMDDVFVKHDLLMLKLVPLALLGAYVLKGLGSYGGSYLMASVGERVIAQLRRELHVHIQGMPLSFFARLHSGELRARIVNDVGRIARLSSLLLVDTVRRLGTIVALLVVMFSREWVLALIATAVFPVVGVVIWALGRRLYRINRRAQQRIGDLFVLLQEAFTSTKIVKAFGREALEQARFDRLNTELLQLGLKDIRIDQLSAPLMEILAAFGIIGALWYGGFRVIGGALTPGEFFSFTTAVVLLYRPIREIFRAFNTVQQSLGAVERVFEILDAPPAIVDIPGARALDGFRDRIEFADVSFRYPGAESDTLREISLTIHRGETVAVVGLSGAGKTTLMDLVPRFHDATAGRITIDGHDLRQVTVASLRALIGLVTQETFLFHETIGYNIAYGKPGASHEEVEHAARLAQAHDFIAALPDGYQTPVGEAGVKLSGGQRQRLAIARAFLKNPPILILDEATSDLDAENEFLVQRALAALMAGRTVLVIAHRFATVRNADRVVVVDGGRIVEMGGHGELMARENGIYRRLASLQRLSPAGG
jgi:ATP-binding cassette, subfamily B, bacterial MsbA